VLLTLATGTIAFIGEYSKPSLQNQWSIESNNSYAAVDEALLDTVILGLLGIVLAPHVAAQNTAQVFVYCEWESAQRDWLPISYDGTMIAKLKAGSFFVIDARLGQHVLGPGNGIPMVLQVHLGDQTFIRLLAT